MMYDTMGNQTGYDDQQAIDDELERKKKEEEQRLKDQAPLGPAVPNTTGLNAPQLQNGQGPGQIPAGEGGIGPAVPPQAQAPAPVQQAPAQGAVVPTPQDQYIAQNESGNNPNIGYHNPKLSSAYGTFGLTKGAYQDIQAADPYFQGKDITQLTPDEQTRANQTYQGVLGKQLQAQGVEATPGNLAAAHFVGAKGLADYDNNGTISKAAADANGGAARVAHIIEERRKMAPAPASGAATGSTLPQGTTEQHLTDIDSGDKNKLMTLAQSPFAPKPVVSMALDTLHQDLSNEQKSQQAAAKVDADLAAGKIPNMNQRGEEGSYIKAYLYQRLGLTDLARQEQQKISPTLKSSATQLEGQNYHIKQDINGEIVKAWNDQGKPVGGSELAKLNANYLALKGATTGQTMGFDKEGNTISHTILPNGRGVVWKNETTGETLKGAPEGYHLGKDQNAMLADSAYKQTKSRLEAENVKQFAATKTNLYSPEKIEEMAQASRNSILGLTRPGVSATTTAPTSEVSSTTPASTTAPVASTTGPSPVIQQAGTTLADPALETQAQSIARGDVAMPTGMGANNRRAQALQNRVYEINPKFDPTVYTAKKKTEEEFASGKQGVTVRSMNVAIDHLDTLQGAANELHNGRLPIFNDIAQKFARATGQPAPGNFDALKSIVGSEVAKAVAGGATALGDREEIRKEINATNSPQQLAGVINKYQQLLGGQLKGLRTEYEAGGGTRFDAKLNERTKRVLGSGESKTAPALPAPFKDTNKESRYQEWLKKHPEFQGNK